MPRLHYGLKSLFLYQARQLYAQGDFCFIFRNTNKISREHPRQVWLVDDDTFVKESEWIPIEERMRVKNDPIEISKRERIAFIRKCKGWLKDVWFYSPEMLPIANAGLDYLEWQKLKHLFVEHPDLHLSIETQCCNCKEFFQWKGGTFATFDIGTEDVLLENHREETKEFDRFSINYIYPCCSSLCQRILETRITKFYYKREEKRCQLNQARKLLKQVRGFLKETQSQSQSL